MCFVSMEREEDGLHPPSQPAEARPASGTLPRQGWPGTTVAAGVDQPVVMHPNKSIRLGNAFSEGWGLYGGRVGPWRHVVLHVTHNTYYGCAVHWVRVRVCNMR